MNHPLHPPRIWIFMVDSRNNEDLRDLDHLNEILWGANPNATKGDIVLMYRTAPFSDIAYVFAVMSEPRPTKPSDRADMRNVVELGDKARLTTPLTLANIKKDARLSRWSFARNQQGAVRRKRDIREEGVWPALRKMLMSCNPSLIGQLARMERRSLDSKGGESGGPPKPSLRVFLSYASPDFEKVKRLYRRLCQEGWLDLWFDKYSLIPADDWRSSITKAIQSVEIVIICLSSHSVKRAGFAQLEIKWALRAADERPEGTTTILPVKLDRCDVPKRLARWQYAELFKTGGYQMLVSGLQKRAGSIRA